MISVVNFMAIHKDFFKGKRCQVLFGKSKSELRRKVCQLGYFLEEFRLYPITPANGVFLLTGVKDGQGTDSN